jgi:large subunit ribosomal protein L6
MSRVGKKIIPLPKGVKITMGKELLVEGPKGKLNVPMPEGIEARQTDGNLEFLRDSDQRPRCTG